ncbi:MAG: cupin domain-containing protein [Steroidobacteraceae bacterium]
MNPRARLLVEQLQLEPHPEGGWFRELYRSEMQVETGDGRAPRAALTTIFYLLGAGDHSRWHRVRSDEAWHLYEGGPLELLLAPPELQRIERVRLGAVGQESGPVHTVPALWWQAARPLGEYALLGCTVGPGFEYEDFSLLEDDPMALRLLQRLDPQLAVLA